jgi:hypothetical protein
MNTQSNLTIELAYPISHDGVTVSSLTLKRPTVSDVMRVNRDGNGPAEIELLMVSLLSGLPAEAVGKLDMQDYGAVQQVLRGMLGAQT